MTDIEIKRKELETAKQIREMGYSCTVGNGIGCLDDLCPFRESDCGIVKPAEWDAFIATREAELAALDKPHDGLTHEERKCKICGGAGFYFAGGATPMESVKRTCECQRNRLTLDAFALALIQGGYYPQTFQSEDSAKWLYRRAVELKAESDRRREA